MGGVEVFFFSESNVSCVVTLCRRGMESRPTNSWLVRSVEVSFVESVMVDPAMVDPVSVDPNLLDQSKLFALLETFEVQALAAKVLFGVLLSPD
jgi:hypothetical protein